MSESGKMGGSMRALPEEPIDGPRAYSIKEVAAMISVHPNTVKRWIGSGELPAVRLSHNLVRIRREDLEAFLAARSAGRPD